MTKAALYLISIYQKVFSILLKNLLGTSHFCRFSPTCSEYTRVQIKEKGVWRGIYLGFQRLLRCHPFGKLAYE